MPAAGPKTADPPAASLGGWYARITSHPLAPPLLFVVSVGAMTFARLGMYPDRVLPIGYGLPLRQW